MPLYSKHSPKLSEAVYAIRMNRYLPSQYFESEFINVRLNILRFCIIDFAPFCFDTIIYNTEALQSPILRNRMKSIGTILMSAYNKCERILVTEEIHENRNRLSYCHSFFWQNSCCCLKHKF